MIVGLIGAGNMGSALARGWHAGDGGPESLLISDIDRSRAEALARETAASVATSNAELAEGADLVVLAVKPGLLERVAGEIKPKAVASVLAGTTIERLEAAFPGVPVIRFMPNVAAEVRQGLFCYVVGTEAQGALRDQVVGLFSLLGEVIELPDHRLGTATALMACGPAFVAYVHEALVDAGIAEGLTAEQSREMVTGTFRGTTALLEATGGNASGIRRRVTTPGGSTEAGIAVLEKAGVGSAFQEAVSVAARKAAGSSGR